METTRERRSNKINPHIDQPFANQPTTDDFIYAYLLDCKQRNLSPRSIKYYENSLHYLQKAFAEQKLVLDLQSVSTSDLQKYFVGFMVEHFA